MMALAIKAMEGIVFLMILSSFDRLKIPLPAGFHIRNFTAAADDSFVAQLQHLTLRRDVLVFCLYIHICCGFDYAMPIPLSWAFF
ncbi:MAG: hypothetical protein IKN60_01820 [Bacteroidales bacterium]|nr:hypothetical protein [Bacteroidales bacterium]